MNGYEGTGRALSLKLMSQLRAQAATPGTGGGGKEGLPAKPGADGGADGGAQAGASAGGGGGGTGGARVFKEVTLEEPIRYSEGDATEAWLSSLLCLEAAKHVPRITRALPHPDKCELYYVNRDTLFSFHAASEVFLQRMIALYGAF